MNTPVHPSYPSKFQLSIEDMSCAACSARVERIAKKFNHVEKIYVNLATGRAQVETDGQLCPDDLIKAICKAGYPTKLHQQQKQKVILDLTGMSCAACIGRVERIIKKHNDISDISVNLATESAQFSMVKGADLVPLLEGLAKAGYEAKVRLEQDPPSLLEKQEQHTKILRRDVLIASALTLPIFLLEMTGHIFPAFHHWISHTIGQQNSWYLQFVLTSLVLVTSGRHFYKTGVTNLLRGAPDMNSLVSVGTLAAYSYSVIATFLPSSFGAQHYAVYYESAAVIICLILFGRLLEAKAKGKSSEAIARLIGLQPKIAHRKNQDEYEDIQTSELQCNDIVLIKPGEKVPLDGIIIQGASYLDESMMTGEPLAVHKKEGDQVIGGTINQQGSLEVKITATGEETVLAHIIQLVEQAQQDKLPIQHIVDKVTLWFVPAVLTIALLTFILWYSISPIEQALSIALMHAIAVLIIACPCAMGLATPMSIMVGIGRAAELGIFFRHGQALQQLKHIKLIAFDKTGTLTLGKPSITDFIITEKEKQPSQCLQYAASVESSSEHPIASAFMHMAKAQNINLLPISKFESWPGLGIQATVDEHVCTIGATPLMQHLNISIEAYLTTVQQLQAQGKSAMFITIDQQIKAIFTITDQLKSDAITTINQLREQQLEVAMISGDQYATAHMIAQKLHIPHVFAEVLPEQKVHTLTTLKQKYGSIAFVGDGINDAPALAHADVGIAIGTGTDIAIEAADVVLMSGAVSGVSHAIQLSNATLRNIKQNLFWSFIYNLLLIPIAMGLLSPWGITLSPMLAAGAMALSSVFVITNALRLKRITLK